MDNYLEFYKHIKDYSIEDYVKYWAKTKCNEVTVLPKYGYEDSQIAIMRISKAFMNWVKSEGFQNMCKYMQIDIPLGLTKDKFEALFFDKWASWFPLLFNRKTDIITSDAIIYTLYKMPILQNYLTFYGITPPEYKDDSSHPYFTKMSNYIEQWSKAHVHRVISEPAIVVENTNYNKELTIMTNNIYEWLRSDSFDRCVIYISSKMPPNLSKIDFEKIFTKLWTMYIPFYFDPEKTRISEELIKYILTYKPRILDSTNNIIINSTNNIIIDSTNNIIIDSTNNIIIDTDKSKINKNIVLKHINILNQNHMEDIILSQRYVNTLSDMLVI
jgi:hypothetical protein